MSSFPDEMWVGRRTTGGFYASDKKSIPYSLDGSEARYIHEEKVTALERREKELELRCKDLEQWASEHGLMILDKKEFWRKDDDMASDCLFSPGDM